MRWLLVALVLVGGCAVTPPNQGLRTTHFVCGQAVRVDINLDGRTAVLHDTTGERVVLKRTESNLGIRYESGGVSILRSGDHYVYYTRDGLALTCEPLRR